MSGLPLRSCALLLFLGACNDGTSPSSKSTEPTLELIADWEDGLDNPTDLAFNSARPDELWVVNHRSDSVTIISNPDDEATRTFANMEDPASDHFMERVSSIAFSDGELFGTCQNSTNTYNNQAPANNFMGPALWTSDMDVFAQTNPQAVRDMTALFGFPADLGSHLDMLHESPNCMGIEWELDNVYWVFDGWDGAIVRYDFAEDHGAGYDDHSDGVISRYVSGQVERVRGVMSHLVLDRDTGLLYIADTGNGRIAVLDTASGVRGESLFSLEITFDGAPDHHRMDNPTFETFVDGLDRPSGIAIADGHLITSEHGTGMLKVYNLADGSEVAALDTKSGPEALAGIWSDSLSVVWFLDGTGDALYRMETGL
jgi:hypothetical protein